MKSELLSKMQWLYGQGFEPDMWYQRCYIDGSDSWIYCKDAIAEFSCYPYFTESCLWSLLPKKLHVKPNDDASGWLGLSNHQLGYFGFYSSTHARVTLNSCADELHTALIDLVIFLIKEEYLNKGQS